MSEAAGKLRGRLGYLTRKGGAMRLFGASVIDQALLSGANFVIGLLLIRYTSDGDYGSFVLVQSALLLLTAAHGAYVCNPLSVLAPQKQEGARLLMLGAIDQSLSSILRVPLTLCIGLVPAFWAAGWMDTGQALLALAALAAGWFALRRDYLRTVAQIHGQPQQILFADFFYVGFSIAAVAIAVMGVRPAAVCAVLGLATAGWAFNKILRASLGKTHGWVVGDASRFWGEILRLGKWAVVGAMLFWLSAQGYNYVLAAKLDTTAVAYANAVRLLVMPVTLLLVGTRSVLLPMAARWLTDAGVAVATRRISAVGLALLLLSAAYLLPLWAVREWMMQNVLRKEITHFDALLVCWGLNAVVGIVRDTYQTILLGCGRHQSLAWTGGASCLLAFAAVWLGVEHFGVIGAVYGLLVGDATYLACILVLLWHEHRRSVARP